MWKAVCSLKRLTGRTLILHVAAMHLSCVGGPMKSKSLVTKVDQSHVAVMQKTSSATIAIRKGTSRGTIASGKKRMVKNKSRKGAMTKRRQSQV